MVTDHERRARDGLQAIESEAVAAGWIEPVGPDREARRLWRACDLASMVEGCFHESVEPAALHAEAERHWLERLRGSFVLPSVDWQDEPGERRYWILDAGRRSGTVKLDAAGMRGPWLSVHSLYVLPPHRGRGVAGTMLDRLARIATRHKLAGIRLATCWTWQRSLRFYIARGFWVYSWKHDIELVLEPELPERHFTIASDSAFLDVVAGGERRRLQTARRDGELLVIDEPEEQAPWQNERDFELWHLGVGTFAMLLALAQWPLVRSEAHWARRHNWLDAGEPEGLACKIGAFEDAARANGWVVDTVRIPGLRPPAR